MAPSKSYLPKSYLLRTYLLSSIGLGLILLHLLLTWKFTQSLDQLILNLIFWSTISALVCQKHYTIAGLQIPWRHHWHSSLFASLLMGLLLGKSITLFPMESEFIRVFPILAGLTLALLTSGWRLYTYSREFLIVVIFMIPPGLLGRLLEWSIGTKVQVLIAQSAAFLMHYAGINLVTQGTTILLKSGSVRVEYACTGIPIWILLLQIASLLGISLRLNAAAMARLLAGATGIAWLLATIRVVIMAQTVAHPAQFEYWHSASGGQVFSTVAIVLFALFCQSQSPMAYGRSASIAQAFSQPENQLNEDSLSSD